MSTEMSVMLPSATSFLVARNPDLEAAAWEGVDRICKSAEFARSKRMIALLRFLVGAYLADELEKLSERSIGQAIFGRAGDWDPTTDTIVRSEVRRLRAKLQIYYDGVGISDPVKIIVPKGAYIPQFEVVAPPEVPMPLPAAGWADQARWRSKPRVLVSAFALLTIGALCFWLAQVRAGLQHQASYKTVPFTSDLGQEFSPAISPDGRWIAYAARPQGDETRIYIKGIDGKGLQAISSPGAISLFPAWSPDGKSLAYLEVEAHRVLVRVSRVWDMSNNGDDHVVTTIARETGRWSDQPSLLLGNPGPIWLPDGRRLILSDCAQTRCGLVIVDDLGRRAWLTTAPSESRDFYPRLSKDGSTVAFVRYYSHGSSDIYTISVKGDNPIQVTHDQKAIQGIAWDRDGRSLVASWDRDGAFALWRIPQHGEPTKLNIDATAPAEPSVSPTSGDIAYVESTENWNIWRAPLSSDGMGKPQLLLSSSGRNYDPRYSPDGKQIAFVSDRSGTMQLWTSSADGSDLKQRTNLGGAWMGGISWSPDGKTIAFDARPRGHSSIYLMALASDALHLLEDNGFEERMPSFSHDGRSLYFNSTRAGEVDIWRYELKSSATRKFQIPNAFAAAELDDSGLLVLGSRYGEIWRTTSNKSSAPVRWNDLVVTPALSWFPAPSGLYFARAKGDDQFEVCRATLVVTKCLGSFPNALVLNGPDIALSPDEHWILFAQQDASTGDIKLASRK